MPLALPAGAHGCVDTQSQERLRTAKRDASRYDQPDFPLADGTKRYRPRSFQRRPSRITDRILHQYGIFCLRLYALLIEIYRSM
jgi:hypothetical protein